MPTVSTKNGDSFWFISYLDGPWQVYSSRTSSNPSAGWSEWGIVNVLTGQHRRAGARNATGPTRTNNYEKANKSARSLNEIERKEVAMRGEIGYNSQAARAAIREAIEECVTQRGATCYQGGIADLERRLEAINGFVENLKSMLNHIDAIEAELGVMNSFTMEKGGSFDIR